MKNKFNHFREELSDVNSRSWTYILLGCCLLFAFLISVTVQYPRLMDPYMFDTDARIHIWWMYQFQDTSLFLNDYLVKISKLFDTPGFSFLYYLAGFVFDPVFFSKLLPIPLALISSFFLFKIGKMLNGNITGFTLACLFMITHYSTITVGVQRSFLFPLMIIFLYYFLKKDHPKTAFTIILQALFYSPAFVVSAFTLGLSFISLNPKKFRENLFSKKFLCFLFAAVVSLAILLPKNTNKNISGFMLNKYISWSKIQEIPEFQPAGRREIFDNYESGNSVKLNILGSHIRIGSSLLEGNNYNRKTCLLISLIIFVILGLKSLRLPKEIYLLLLSGGLLYIFALMFLFALYLPARYFPVCWSLFLLIYISVNLTQVADKTVNLAGTNLKDKIDKVRFIFVFIILSELFFLISIKGFLAEKSYTATYYPPEAIQKIKLINFIKILPKHTYLAGELRLLADIPILSNRSVYINEKFIDFDDETKKRTYKLIDAYYSDSNKEIKKFCQDEKIDYFVVDLKSFDYKKYPYRIGRYFYPYNEYITNEYLNKNRNFVLAKPQKDKVVFYSYPFYVLSCK